MRINLPGVEWWPQKNVAQHIAAVGRICYHSNPQQPDDNLSEEQKEKFIQERDEKRCQSFWDNGHRSMWRHGSAYFFCKNQGRLPRFLWAFLSASPYIDYAEKDKRVWISTNMQFLTEHANIIKMLEPFSVEESEFIAMAQKYECKSALWLLRMTMVVTSQISTSRELNRTSPNAISEQSTRYVNLKKKGGVQIAKPHWLDNGTRWQRFLYKTGCRVSDWIYRQLLKTGLPPQDARGILVLDTYTVVAYTYNLYEWQHILDLRFHERTGKAHPNAKEVGTLIHNLIVERMQVYDKDFKI